MKARETEIATLKNSAGVADDNLDLERRKMNREQKTLVFAITDLETNLKKEREKHETQMKTMDSQIVAYE